MKRWRLLLSFALVVLALIGAHYLLRSARVPAAQPMPGAQWIWSQLRGKAGAPMAFFAVKDFEVDFPVASADLRILADEEHLVSLNGRPIGAGSYLTSNAPVSYALGGLRRRNRLLVELRSPRGAGGLLLHLALAGAAGEEAAVVSDGSWRIVHRFSRSLRRPGRSYEGEAPLVWGPQPSGRWEVPATVGGSQTLRELQKGRPRALVPAVREGSHGSPWRPAPRRGEQPLGRWARLDFGRTRTGYLNLRFADAVAGSGFVFYQRRKPTEGLEDPGEVVLRIAGRERWTASRPATFRYVTVVGLPALTSAEIIPVDPARAAGLLAREPRRGLFGIERRRTLMSPVEDEVRRQLEGVPGFARRKKR